jgi:hypothetical protein
VSSPSAARAPSDGGQKCGHVWGHHA